VHQDVPGMIAKVSQLLSSAEVNIGTMTVTRESKGEKAIMIIEVDERNEAILEQIRALDSIYNASYFG
jgi:L-serine dehydratase